MKVIVLPLKNKDLNIFKRDMKEAFQKGAERGQTVNAIKGGSWYANPNSCKITMQGEGRKPKLGYNTVGFRVVATKK